MIGEEDKFLEYEEQEQERLEDERNNNDIS